MRKLDPGARAIVCSIALTISGALGCGDREPAHTVTPAPVVPAAEPVPAEPVLPQGRDVPAPAPAPSAVRPEAIASAKPADKPQASAKPRADKPERDSSPAKPARDPAPPAPAASHEPVPALPSTAPPPPPPPVTPPAPPPAKASKVTVPSTEHVSIDIPKGMQALLDADTRMQPWVNNVVAVADRCYKSKAMGTSATIVVDVTMHENARPDADIRTLPGSLSGVVACATGDLMRAKRMPLFTGPEGARHTLKIKFK